MTDIKLICLDMDGTLWYDILNTDSSKYGHRAEKWER